MSWCADCEFRVTHQMEAELRAAEDATEERVVLAATVEGLSVELEKSIIAQEVQPKLTHSCCAHHTQSSAPGGGERL